MAVSELGDPGGLCAGPARQTIDRAASFRGPRLALVRRTWGRAVSQSAGQALVWAARARLRAEVCSVRGSRNDADA